MVWVVWQETRKTFTCIDVHAVLGNMHWFRRHVFSHQQPQYTDNYPISIRRPSRACNPSANLHAGDTKYPDMLEYPNISNCLAVNFGIIISNLYQTQLYPFHVTVVFVCFLIHAEICVFGSVVLIWVRISQRYSGNWRSGDVCDLGAFQKTLCWGAFQKHLHVK